MILLYPGSAGDQWLTSKAGHSSATDGAFQPGQEELSSSLWPSGGETDNE